VEILVATNKYEKSYHIGNDMHQSAPGVFD